MGARADKTMEKYRQQVQAKVGEPLESVAFLSRHGSMKAVGLHYISPAAAAVSRHRAKKQSGGLPESVVLAVTPTRVLLYKLKVGWGGLKLKDPIRTYPRGEIRAYVTEQSGMATTVHFETRSGEAFDLDANKMPWQDAAAGLDRSFIAALTIPG